MGKLGLTSKPGQRRKCLSLKLQITIRELSFDSFKTIFLSFFHSESRTFVTLCEQSISKDYSKLSHVLKQSSVKIRWDKKSFIQPTKRHKQTDLINSQWVKIIRFMIGYGGILFQKGINFMNFVLPFETLKPENLSGNEDLIIAS